MNWNKLCEELDKKTDSELERISKICLSLVEAREVVRKKENWKEAIEKVFG